MGGGVFWWLELLVQCCLQGGERRQLGREGGVWFSLPQSLTSHNFYVSRQENCLWRQTGLVLRQRDGLACEAAASIAVEWRLYKNCTLTAWRAFLAGSYSFLMQKTLQRFMKTAICAVATLVGKVFMPTSGGQKHQHNQPVTSPGIANSFNTHYNPWACWRIVH